MAHTKGAAMLQHLPPPTHTSKLKKKIDFADTVISKVLRELGFNLKHPQKLADD